MPTIAAYIGAALWEPDRGDLTGGIVCLTGAAIILVAPR